MHKVDVESVHERDEEDAPAPIRRIEAEKQRRQAIARGGASGVPSESTAPRPCGSLPRPGKLTEYKNRSGEVSSVLAWDDLTNMRLGAGKVVEARNKEIEYARDMRVSDKILRAQAIPSGWKIIKTRWIYINKGDDENPKYRSRLVGKLTTMNRWGSFRRNPVNWRYLDISSTRRRQ